MNYLTLISGGARSGKSSFALEHAEKYYQKRAFIATATAMDKEMEDRIVKHKKERGNRYRTYEEQFDLITVLTTIPKNYEVVVIDCLTVWIGNLFYTFNNSHELIENTISEFISYISHPPINVICVTNEVGAGIIPENNMARAFRDVAGMTNSSLAQQASSVYICFCGIPVKIK